MARPARPKVDPEDVEVAERVGAGPFGMAYRHIIRDRSLPRGVKTLYAYFTTYATGIREAHPSRETIAADVDLSVTAVDEAIKVGAACGLWSIVKVETSRGYCYHKYVLHDLPGVPGAYVAGSGPGARSKGKPRGRSATARQTPAEAPADTPPPKSEGGNPPPKSGTGHLQILENPPPESGPEVIPGGEDQVEGRVVAGSVVDVDPEPWPVGTTTTGAGRVARRLNRTARSQRANSIVTAFAATQRRTRAELVDLAREIDKLIPEGFTDEEFAGALALWGTKGLHARTFPSVLGEHLNPRRAQARPSRPSTTDARLMQQLAEHQQMFNPDGSFRTSSDPVPTPALALTPAPANGAHR